MGLQSDSTTAITHINNSIYQYSQEGSIHVPTTYCICGNGFIRNYHMQDVVREVSILVPIEFLLPFISGSTSVSKTEVNIPFQHTVLGILC